jgi:hypothetical protein
VAPRRLFGEHELAVHGHFEESAGSLEQPDFRIRKGLLELSRQTGGFWLVVSNNAILNGHVHVAADSYGVQSITPRIVVPGVEDAKGTEAM